VLSSAASLTKPSASMVPRALKSSTVNASASFANSRPATSRHACPAAGRSDPPAPSDAAPGREPTTRHAPVKFLNAR
jgi:hypothetical protein